MWSWFDPLKYKSQKRPLHAAFARGRRPSFARAALGHEIIGLGGRFDYDGSRHRCCSCCARLSCRDTVRAPPRSPRDQSRPVPSCSVVETRCDQGAKGEWRKKDGCCAEALAVRQDNLPPGVFHPLWHVSAHCAVQMWTNTKKSAWKFQCFVHSPPVQNSIGAPILQRVARHCRFRRVAEIMFTMFSPDTALETE